MAKSKHNLTAIPAPPLAACPFCGTSGPNEQRVERQPHAEPRFAVACAMCRTLGPLADSAEKAVEYWNDLEGARRGDGPAVDRGELLHRLGIVEAAVGLARQTIWDNAPALDRTQSTGVACVMELAQAELARIGGTLDTGGPGR